MLTSVAVSPDDVKRACCAYFNVEMEELEGLDRSKKIATARHVAMFLTRRLTASSMSEVGLAFNRSHASVVYGIDRTQLLVTSRPDLRRAVETIGEQLGYDQINLGIDQTQHLAVTLDSEEPLFERFRLAHAIDLSLNSGTMLLATHLPSIVDAMRRRDCEARASF